MAVTLDAAVLAKAIGAKLPADQEAVERLRAVAGQAVEDYAPDAPEALQNEACLRISGYWFGSDFGGIERESLGPQDFTYARNHADAFRRSGAAMLLTRYRVRRAGLAG